MLATEFIFDCLFLEINCYDTEEPHQIGQCFL